MAFGNRACRQEAGAQVPERHRPPTTDGFYFSRSLKRTFQHGETADPWPADLDTTSTTINESLNEPRLERNMTTPAPPRETPTPPRGTPTPPRGTPAPPAVNDSCRGDYKLVSGACVRLYNNWKSHAAAMTACKADGATLAMPKTEELDVALRDLVKTEGNKAYHWIGMEDKDGTWYWVDDSLVGSNGYKGWSPGEPNELRWFSLCGQYWSGGPTSYPMWSDDTCFLLKRFICQRRPSA
ncbi:CD209 [Branchiostoma lanceolatum]|uniref:CD209 protein n=1 Tax=Branchiostoma lanceolatum TaxID=7740 RepID=A0A8J9ZEX8_BRALA|nr:CD209 [Branchiostoma lanceolatum]